MKFRGLKFTEYGTVVATGTPTSRTTVYDSFFMTDRATIFPTGYVTFYETTPGVVTNRFTLFNTFGDTFFATSVSTSGPTNYDTIFNTTRGTSRWTTW